MSDDQVLSQAEVESLLSSMDTATAAAPSVADHEPAEQRPKIKISPYDFKRPERVGKEQMRALQTLHEGFGRNVGAGMSALLRTMVEVKLTSVDQLTFSEFVFGLENPTCFVLLTAEPLKGNLVLDINPSILFPMLDRMLGGGKETPVSVRRPLTEIERRLAQRIVGLFLTEMQLARSNVIELDLAIDRIESNAQLVSIVPPNEVVVLIGFELSMQGVRGMLNLCIPYNSIERFSSTLVANSWQGYGRGFASEETRKHIAMEMENSNVEMTVTLAESRITTAELLGLRVGDIITTEHDVKRPLSISVGGHVKYLGRPGAIKGHKAFQVEEVVYPVERPSPNALTSNKAKIGGDNGTSNTGTSDNSSEQGN